MKSKYIFWILVLVALSYTVLYFIYKPNKLAKIILPDFSKVEEVEAVISNDTLHLNALGFFQSESFLPLIVDSLEYNFFVEDCVLYKNKKLIDVNLLPGETDTVNVDLHIPFARIKRVSNYIKPEDSVTIGVTCKVIYKYFGQHIPLEFTKKGKIARPVPPKIKLAGIGKKKIKDWGKNIETEAKLLVINKGKNLRLKIHSLEYDIVVGDKITGHGKYMDTVRLKPMSSTMVTIPVSFKVDKPLKTAYQLLFKKDRVKYRLRASAMVDLNAKKHPDIRVELKAEGDTEFSLGKK